jgi:hypothetical protein
VLPELSLRLEEEHMLAVWTSSGGSWCRDVGGSNTSREYVGCVFPSDTLESVRWVVDPKF